MAEATASLPEPIAARRFRLANGLEVCLLPIRQAPIVSTVLVYRVGGRDEAKGESGIAHFLEHMMFRGSARFGPGEIDRRTQALGGTNNAFTSHDLTAYYFAFASDRWQEALAIEVDRMSALTLDPTSVESERQVILEEIAMYRDDPWDALELAVQEALFPEHPYAVPVLGFEEDLARTGRDRLVSFHQRYYRPGNALLVVAGDLGESCEEAIESQFGKLPAGAVERSMPPRPQAPRELRRLERRQGEVARLQLAFAVPAPDHDDHGGLKLLATLLGGGRTSPLYRELVDEGQLCLSAAAGLTENALVSQFAISCELLPGSDPSEVERRIFGLLAALREAPPGEELLTRSRQILLADWVFQQERIHQQALTAAIAAAQFDLDQPLRQLQRALASDGADLRTLAARYLDPERGAVLGLSRPPA